MVFVLARVKNCIHAKLNNFTLSRSDIEIGAPLLLIYFSSYFGLLVVQRFFKGTLFY